MIDVYLHDFQVMKNLVEFSSSTRKKFPKELANKYIVLTTHIIGQ